MHAQTGVSSTGWRVTSWPGNPRRCSLRRGASCTIPPIHGRGLDGSSSNLSIHQIIIILYITHVYSYILGATHRPETRTPALAGLGETPGMPASRCAHPRARRHTPHRSPTTGTFLLVRPVGAVPWARVGSQRTFVCHRRRCQVASAARPNRLARVVSWPAGAPG
jgi:hypothetical protein